MANKPKLMILRKNCLSYCCLQLQNPSLYYSCIIRNTRSSEFHPLRRINLISAHKQLCNAKSIHEMHKTSRALINNVRR